MWGKDDMCGAAGSLGVCQESEAHLVTTCLECGDGEVSEMSGDICFEGFVATVNAHTTFVTMQ